MFLPLSPTTIASSWSATPAYMVKKMRDAEVTLSKLRPHDRELFTRATSKEVRSFIADEAGRQHQ